MKRLKDLSTSKYSPYIGFLILKRLHAHLILHSFDPLMNNLIVQLNFASTPKIYIDFNIISKLTMWNSIFPFNYPILLRSSRSRKICSIPCSLQWVSKSMFSNSLPWSLLIEVITKNFHFKPFCKTLKILEKFIITFLLQNKTHVYLEKSSTMT